MSTCRTLMAMRIGDQAPRRLKRVCGGPMNGDEAYLAARANDEYPGDLEGYENPDHAPPSLDDAQLAALIAQARQVGREITADQARRKRL